MRLRRGRRRGGFRGAFAVGAIGVGFLGLVPAVAVAGPGPSATAVGVQGPEGDAVAASVPVGGRYLDEVFVDVDVTTDVAYRETVSVTGDPVTLALDIYEPAGDTVERRPV